MFHSLCDGKGSTITVVKTTLGYILGGYTSLAWSSCGCYKNDLSAFVYTLTNPSNKPLKLAVNAQGTNAVIDCSWYGPSFGNGHDLYIADQSNSNTYSHANSNSYAYPNGLSGGAGGNFMVGGATNNRNFQTVEIEVYLVTTGSIYFK